MTDIVDDQISEFDRKIAELMSARQERIDFLVNPERKRVREIYGEIGTLFKELESLKDWPYTPTEVYVGYDEQETRDYPVSFEGKYFTFNDGTIMEK